MHSDSKGPKTWLVYSRRGKKGNSGQVLWEDDVVRKGEHTTTSTISGVKGRMWEGTLDYC